MLTVMPMDPGVPLHLGLPLILGVSPSAQQEQAMGQCSLQRKSSLSMATLQELLCGARFPGGDWSCSGL